MAMTDHDSSRSVGLHYSRAGRGAPMLLIHGIGHRHEMWTPIIDRLSSDFDTVAVDLPGFGQTARLDDREMPTPQRLADSVEATMDALGWTTAHLVGNSLGAWISLELASRGRASSVCALMPAGLWRSLTGISRARVRSLFAFWTTGSRLPFAGSLVRSPALRTPALYGLFGRPWKISEEVAVGDVLNLRNCDFDRTMTAMDGIHFESGAEITAPVTVVFGGRDPLIRPRETDLSRLPNGTQAVQIAHLGHVPTWDDPELVATIVEQACQRD